MSVSFDLESNWNFRILDKRLIVAKTKNESVSKIVVLDVLTNLTFSVEVPDMISMKGIDIDREYLASLRIYTVKEMGNVDKDFINFFAALDIDQSSEDFIKAYWIYPSKIRFELAEIEEA
jgi:hypothetical protein